jgi:sugar lactone lactonase YvrE
VLPHDLTCLHTARATLGEGPVWDARRHALWWVDIKERLLHRFNLAPSGLGGQAAGPWPLPGQVGCLGLWGDTALILALETGIHAFDPSTATLRRLGTLAPEPGATRFNDGKVDPAGRFWVGTLDDTTFPASGALYSIKADGQHHRHLDDICCANGIGWTADGTTMFFTDSVRRVIWRFAFDLAEGALSD